MATKKKAAKKKSTKKSAPKRRTPAVVKAAAEKTGKAALMTVVDVELDPDNLSREYIRHAAGIFYETHLDGVSIYHMATEHPIFSAIPRRTLEKWMVADKWTDRRKKFFADLHLKITKSIGDKLTQQHITMVQDFQTVSRIILERLMPTDHVFVRAVDDEGEPIDEGKVCAICQKPYLPTHDPFFGVSGDKLVTSLVKLNAEMREMTNDLLQTILPQLHAANQGSTNPTGGAVPVETALSKDEARAAAKEVLRIRRDGIREAKGE